MHGLKISTDKYPGILMNVEFDKNGDLDRESFIVEVKNGKQEVIAMVPPLNEANVNAKMPAPAKK